MASSSFFLKVIFVATMVLLATAGTAAARTLHNIHWNRQNPVFRQGKVDHVVHVNAGNNQWEYDQVNIICPMSKPGVPYPEKHIVYSVSREEYDSCRITNPKPKIVAICNQPHRLMYFTITFRSFTPTPGGLEFHPGHDYYFISTASRDDLHRRVDGGCSTHNMKMVFKVADNRATDSLGQSSEDEHNFINKPRGETLVDSLNDNNLEDDGVATAPATTTTTTTERVSFPLVEDSSASSGSSIYFYHPRDLISLERNLLGGGSNQRRRHYADQLQQQQYGVVENWRRKKPLQLVSSGVAHQSWNFLALLLPLSLMVALQL